MKRRRREREERKSSSDRDLSSHKLSEEEEDSLLFSPFPFPSLLLLPSQNSQTPFLLARRQQDRRTDGRTPLLNQRKKEGGRDGARSDCRPTAMKRKEGEREERKKRRPPPPFRPLVFRPFRDGPFSLLRLLSFTFLPWRVGTLTGSPYEDSLALESTPRLEWFLFFPSKKALSGFQGGD